MSKIFRIVSTVMIAIGIVFLLLYVQSQGSSKVDVLNQPSYYVTQSYWLVFVSGSAVIGFSLLGSFFSWFKSFDTTEDILPNAGYASGQDIEAWVKGSTADYRTKKGILPSNDVVDTDETRAMPPMDETELDERTEAFISEEVKP